MRKQQAYIQHLLRDFPGAEELLGYEDYQNIPAQTNADIFIRQVQEDFAEPMSRMENYLGYVSHRLGVQMDNEYGLWCAGGKVRNLSQAAREVMEHIGSMWTPVVAIRRGDVGRLGYNDVESWRQLACACASKIVRGYKIPLEYLRWYATPHRKGDSVHIHMVVFSSDPREDYLTKRGIQQVKSAFGRRIFQQDLLYVYEQKTEYQNTLNRDTECAMAKLVVQMEQDQFQDENLEQLILGLSRRLQNTKGEKVYGYLPPVAKVLMDAIVDEPIKDERVAAAYGLQSQMRGGVCRAYSEQLLGRLPFSKQKEFKTMHDMIIREMFRLGRREPPTTDEVVHGFIPSGTSPAQSGIPRGVYHPQQRIMHHQRTQIHWAISHADTARYVLQLLHSMGRIFQEQPASDAIQTGLYIDKKRHRMLRRKCTALGHKTDDHEELRANQWGSNQSKPQPQLFI